MTLSQRCPTAIHNSWKNNPKKKLLRRWEYHTYYLPTYLIWSDNPVHNHFKRYGTIRVCGRCFFLITGSWPNVINRSKGRKARKFTKRDLKRIRKKCEAQS